MGKKREPICNCFFFFYLHSVLFLFRRVEECFLQIYTPAPFLLPSLNIIPPRSLSVGAWCEYLLNTQADILFCTIQYCIIKYCNIQYCTIQYYTIYVIMEYTLFFIRRCFIRSWGWDQTWIKKEIRMPAKLGKSSWIDKINSEVFEPESCTHIKMDLCGY